MKRKRTVNPGTILIYAILGTTAAFFIFPVVFMFIGSFMDSYEVIEHYGVIFGKEDSMAADYIRLVWIPERVSLMQYYQALLRRPKYLMMFWNSVRLTVPIVSGQAVTGAMAAYAFAKLRFPVKKGIFFAYIVVMLMPFQATLVPNYIILHKLNILDKYIAVILPGIFHTFGVFLLRQFMIMVPDEYMDAAKIDGAGHFIIFSRIILPQCKGALASLLILSFIDNWNMVEQPLIFLRDYTMHPLSVLMGAVNSEELGIAFACGALYMAPVLLLFLYSEDYIIEGIQLSGLK